MTETERLLLSTLKQLESDRRATEKSMMTVLEGLARRVNDLEKLAEQVASLSEQNIMLTEQLSRLVVSSKQ